MGVMNNCTTKRKISSSVNRKQKQHQINFHRISLIFSMTCFNIMLSNLAFTDMFSPDQKNSKSYPQDVVTTQQHRQVCDESQIQESVSYPFDEHEGYSPKEKGYDSDDESMVPLEKSVTWGTTNKVCRHYGPQSETLWMKLWGSSSAF